jgi:carboxyl-terminal processing protease
MRELEVYLQKINSVELFVQYAEKQGLKRRNLMIQRSHKLLERYVNSRVIYNMMGEAEWTEYLNGDDPAIKESLRVFKAGEAFPKADKAKKSKQTAYDYRSTHLRTGMVARV